MMNRKILIVAGIVILVCLIAGCFLLWKQVPTQSPSPPPPPAKPKKELKLSDFPEAFKDGTLIIVGDNASEIELQAANEIADYLQKQTGNKPLIKKYSEISNEDKRNYNLIVVGTPKTNPLLEEVYTRTNATKITKEFPGEGKGVLEILPNPWDESKAMLLVEGWEEETIIIGVLHLKASVSYDELLSSISIGEKSLNDFIKILNELYPLVKLGSRTEETKAKITTYSEKSVEVSDILTKIFSDLENLPVICSPEKYQEARSGFYDVSTDVQTSSMKLDLSLVIYIEEYKLKNKTIQDVKNNINQTLKASYLCLDSLQKIEKIIKECYECFENTKGVVG